MATAFRQIGLAPNGTPTVKQHLKRAQGRFEAVLNRSRLPTPAAMLRALQRVQESIRAAYRVLPLQRLVMLDKELTALYEEVDYGIFFGRRPNETMLKTVRGFYRDLTRILHDLDEKPKLKPPQFDDNHIRNFLSQAAQRGWRVQGTAPDPEAEYDGFRESVDHIRRLSIPITNLLPSDKDFGLTKASALLLNEGRIPETVLLEWTQMPTGLDVFMVFGNYVVLSEVTFLGVKSSLVLLRGEDGNAYLDIARFLRIASYLQHTDKNLDTDHLITKPCRVGPHYYCPVLAVKPTQRRYFQKWDILVA